MNKGSYLYGVTVLVHNQNLSIMSILSYTRFRNGYVIWSVIYILLSLIGGSINPAEWSVNALLLFALAATARVHLTLVAPNNF